MTPADPCAIQQTVAMAAVLLTPRKLVHVHAASSARAAVDDCQARFHGAGVGCGCVAEGGVGNTGGWVWVRRTRLRSRWTMGDGDAMGWGLSARVQVVA